MLNKNEIEALKAKHRTVYKISLESGEVYYVRRPTIKEIEFAGTNLTTGRMIQFGISLFKSCYLGGDEMPAEESKLMSVGGKMQETIETVAAEVEKL